MNSVQQTMWFEPLFRAKSGALRLAVDTLYSRLCEHEVASGRRKRARKEADAKALRLAVEALACNLILLRAAGDRPKLAVPRSHDVLWKANASPVYGQHFLTAIDLMADLRLIEEDRRGYRLSARSKMPSLIFPAHALADYLPLRPPDWLSVEQIDEQASIILKSDKDEKGYAAALAFSETARTRQLAAEVRRINKYLRAANIQIGGTDSGLSLGKDGQIVAPYRRTLRRVFNNANWQHGGRLAGGFWMSMERAERFKRIRIDGERIADVDYRQLFPRLAYVRAGENQPEGDIYDVVGDGTGRGGWKKLMNAMLFSEGPLKNWPADTREHFPEGMHLRTAIDMLSRKHAPIAALFGTGLGFQLMRIESDMLIRVIIHLDKLGVTALPLHDAVLVAESKAPVAVHAMQAAFSMGAGSPCAIVSTEFCTG